MKKQLKHIQESRDKKHKEYVEHYKNYVMYLGLANEEYAKLKEMEKEILSFLNTLMATERQLEYREVNDDTKSNFL